MLIDTNVWSELLRPEPLDGVVALLAKNQGTTLLSTIVLAEMEFGIARLSASRRRDQLRAFADDIVTRHADRTIAPDRKSAAVFGNLRAMLFARGEPIADLDLMIAAQAIAADVPLVTRNVSDMARTGARIINPWAP